MSVNALTLDEHDDLIDLIWMRCPTYVSFDDALALSMTVHRMQERIVLSTYVHTGFECGAL